MPSKTKTKVSREIRAKAREVLQFAEERAKQVTYSNELFNALFSPEGRATQLFTPAERSVFLRTKESKQIDALIDALPPPPVQNVGNLMIPPNGAVTVHLPRSVYRALLDEAKAEGVSLDQLCLSKLIAQLRSVVN